MIIEKRKHYTAWRIADSRFPIISGQGAARMGARWNSEGREAIYASLSYSCAMLEILANASIGRVPKHHKYVKITIPASVAIEELDAEKLAGWNDESCYTSKRYGDKWLDEKRSAVLIVPSIVTMGMEKNIVINPLHEDYKKIIFSSPEAVVWDKRIW